MLMKADYSESVRKRRGEPPGCLAVLVILPIDGAFLGRGLTDCPVNAADAAAFVSG
jgi:hypothetical protein